MTEKFVRDCDNVTDIKKVDFIMARQSDLIHTTDGKEWVMNNGKPEQISGAVVSMGTAENENKDVQVTFNANKNGTPSKVGSIIMGGNGFEYDSDKSIIHNKGINSVSGNPSSTVGSGTDGSVYFERTDTTKENEVDVLGQINFKSTDFVVTTEEQSGTEVINVSTVEKSGNSNIFSADVKIKQDNNDIEIETDAIIIKGKNSFNVKIAVPEGNQFSIDNALHLSLTSDLFKNIKVGGGVCSLTAPLLNNDNYNREVYIYECQHTGLDNLLLLDGYAQNPMGKSCSSLVTFFEFMLPYTEVK